jgi:glycosyltransferase involved in cell wall biosynthesis
MVSKGTHGLGGAHGTWHFVDAEEELVVVMMIHESRAACTRTRGILGGMLKRPLTPPKPLRVLVVGQTPPPFGGQAAMIELLLAGTYDGVELRHVRMRYSRTIDQAGSFRLGKLLRLLQVVAGIVCGRVVWGADVMYYHPAGANRVAIMRDLATLVLTRWMFKRTVFHMHAGGLARAGAALPAWMRPLFRIAYHHPDVMVEVSRNDFADARGLQPKVSFIVPNAVPDSGGPYALALEERRSEPVRTLLFLNLVSEEKGSLVLLDAFAQLPASVQLVVAGVFAPPGFRARFDARAREVGVDDRVRVVGEVRGDDKTAAFAEADVFVSPTHHPTETFGLVVAEAASFGLPIVATRWGGLPSLVDDGENVVLCEPRDAASLASALQRVFADTALRKRLGRNARRLFERRFTADRYHDDLQGVFNHVREDLRAKQRAGGA